MRVLILGCGYVGLPLGAELVRQGHEVFGLRRNPAAADEIKAAGLKPLFGDITKLESLEKLPREFDWVVNCAGSGGGTERDYQQTYLEGNRNVVAWLGKDVCKCVYTSSTSVYAQNDGSVVDETMSAAPETSTGKILVATEKLLLAAATENKFPAIILRVAGIYGPGRGYWLKQFLAGEAKIEGDGGRFLNMIHRDDVIGCIIATLKHGRPGSVLNAVDNEPVSQLKMFEWLSRYLSKPVPPFASEKNVQKGGRRSVTNKRVSNLKLRSETGCEFKFPTFREGYTAELKALGVICAA